MVLNPPSTKVCGIYTEIDCPRYLISKEYVNWIKITTLDYVKTSHSRYDFVVIICFVWDVVLPCRASWPWTSTLPASVLRLQAWASTPMSHSKMFFSNLRLRFLFKLIDNTLIALFLIDLPQSQGLKSEGLRLIRWMGAMLTAESDSTFMF